MKASRRAAATFVAGVLLIGLTACASAPSRPAVRTYGFPAPFEGPGCPDAGPTAAAAIRDGWLALREGRQDAALEAARKAGNTAQSHLLAYQVALVAGAGGLIEPLRDLAQSHPEWASAWITFSVAAENEGRTDEALKAAARGASLWPEARWTGRLAELRRSALGLPLEQAQEALDAGSPDQALAQAQGVLSLDPSSVPAQLLEVRALMALGRSDEAWHKVGSLTGTPEGAALAAKLAEARGDWTEALNLYQQLPKSWPGRERGLARIKLMWRLENVPNFVRKALESPSLTRAQLAIIIVALAPEVEADATGPAPLLPDIVGIPGQREVLAVVRTQILKPRTSSSFAPEDLVTPKGVADALARLASRLNRDLPPACASTATPACLNIVEPVTGESVKQAVWAILLGEDAQ
jgi:tetratricopeptide (TPR) repeat protein